jgi:chromosome segregation ATPase
MLNIDYLTTFRQTVEAFTHMAQQTIQQLDAVTADRTQAMADNLRLEAELTLAKVKRDDALRRLETSTHTNNALRVQLRDERVDNEHLRGVCQRAEAFKASADSVQREAQLHAALQEAVLERDQLREQLKSVADTLQAAITNATTTVTTITNPAPIMFGYYTD